MGRKAAKKNEKQGLIPKRQSNPKFNKSDIKKEEGIIKNSKKKSSQKSKAKKEENNSLIVKLEANNNGNLINSPSKLNSINQNFEKIKICIFHNNPIEFICKNAQCLQDLCGHCILSHKNHIEYIESINTILTNFNNDNQYKETSLIINEIKKKHQYHQNTLQQVQDVIISEINVHFEQINKNMTQHHQLSTSLVDGLGVFKTKSQQQNLKNFNHIDNDTFNLVKQYIQFTQKSNISNTQILNNNNSNNNIILNNNNNNQNIYSLHQDNFQINLLINQDVILKEINTSLQNNLYLSSEENSLQSTNFNCPKVLHWFEWGKKRLNMYDIVSHTTNMIDLEIAFKIPSFSRSILLPCAKIYLMGGEEPEFYSRKEVYMYDIVLNDKKLYQKANMPHKKFDFTLCYMNGYIYSLCGKDGRSEVVSSCERYKVEDNTWQQIAPVKKKRYAASAVGCTNGKVFLFGGRSDNNNMVAEIEEYSESTNVWQIVSIRENLLNLWNPVEVCACIQISKDKIFIFGGSDVKIKDTNNAIIFNMQDYTLEKKEELKRSQVFVTAPFLLGKYVYAIGNEYYMKNRNLHKYSLENEQWDVIFQSN